MKRHQLITYFLMAYAFAWIPWSYLLFTTTPGDLTTKGPTPTFLALAFLGGFAPSIAGLIMSRLSGPKGAASELVGRLRRGRAPLVCYAVTLCTVVAINLVVYVLYAATGRELALGDVLGRLGLGLVWPIFSSFGEELGWRGFALPRLQAMHNPLSGTLILGLGWGMWHSLADFIGLGDQGGLFIINFLLLGPILLTAVAVVMTWVYNRSGNNLLLMVLFHYTVTSSGIILAIPGLVGIDAVIANALYAGVFSLIALTIIIMTKGRLGAKIPHIVTNGTPELP
jgi:membrane protease YdiL (CAAX protease family)